MASQYTERNESREADAGGHDRAAYSKSDSPNFGSARSDYGEHAYGGRLDKRGLESRGLTSHLSEWLSSRREGDGKGYRNRRSIGWGKGLLVLGGGIGIGLGIGIGTGAALMYIFDPKQGKQRRALVRDKATSLSDKAGKSLGKASTNLRNRAQGLAAEARGMLGSEKSESGMPGGARVDEAGTPTTSAERSKTKPA